MAGILGSAIPTITGSKIARSTLQLIFKDSAILLDDGASMALSSVDNFLGTNLSGGLLGSVASSVSVPLLGFAYDNPSQMEILKYSYSEYPFLNKNMIVNSYLRENTRITLRASKAITPNNTVALNYLSNETIYSTLETYCNAGGTFTIMTMWGAYSGLVLESLSGIQPENNQMGGTQFEFTFLKPQFSASGGLLGSIASGLKSLVGGFF